MKIPCILKDALTIQRKNMKRTAKSFAPSAMPAFKVTITTASETPVAMPVLAKAPVAAEKLPSAPRRKSVIRPVKKSVLKVTIDVPASNLKVKEAAAVQEDEEDVSAIDLSKFMTGEIRDPKLDKKNAKAAAKQGFIAKTDSMKLYMNEVGQIPLISPEQRALVHFREVDATNYASLEKALEGRFSPLNYATKEKVQAEIEALKQ